MNIFTHIYTSVFSCVLLFATPWTVAHQSLLSMGFSRQEFWSGLPFPPPGDLSESEIEPTAPVSPASAGRFFTTVNIFRGPLFCLPWWVGEVGSGEWDIKLLWSMGY